jgi:hypothetical protein
MKTKQDQSLRVDILTKVWAAGIAWWREHLVFITAVAILVYLVLFQWPFFHTGDTWAESFTEYLDQAVHLPLSDITAPSWVGYLTVIPSALSQAYIGLNLPLGVVDYFFRAITLVFVVGCASFVASSFNREVIRSDILRVALAVGFVLLIGDVATFSFINCWYVGFVPLILITLSQRRLSYLQQVLYVLFGAALVFTKPSLILAPFLVYRAIRTKEYISSGLLLVAVAVQTYCLLFLSQGSTATAAADLGDVIRAMSIGITSAMFKFVHVFPGNSGFSITIALSILVLMTYGLWRARGFWVTVLIGFGLALSVYGHVLAPGEIIISMVHSVGDFYNYNLKAQREYMIAIFLLLWIFLLLPGILTAARKYLLKRYAWLPLVVVLVLLVGLGTRVYRPINAGLLSNLGPYRSTLDAKQSICIPLPVPSLGSTDAGWVFQNKGGCAVGNTKLKIDTATFTRPVNPALTIDVLAPQDHRLMSVLFLLRTSPTISTPMSLYDNDAGTTYYATLYPARDSLSAVSFNLSDLPERDIYHLTLTAGSEYPRAGFFQGTTTPVYYPYFMGRPQ